MNIITVSGTDLSTAWLAACRAMSRSAPVAYHTVVRIHDPAGRRSPDPGGRRQDPRRGGSPAR